MFVKKNTETAFNLLATDELNSNTLNELIQNGGIKLNTFNNELFPLFALECMKGDTEMVEMLIKVGADVHAKDNSLNTPLHLTNIEILKAYK